MVGFNRCDARDVGYRKSALALASSDVNGGKRDNGERVFYGAEKCAFALAVQYGAVQCVDSSVMLFNRKRVSESLACYSALIDKCEAGPALGRC